MLCAATLLMLAGAACNKSSPSAPSDSTPPPTGLTLSSTTLTFTAQAVGTTSGAQTLTLTNNNGTTVNLPAPQVSGEFSAANGCGNSLAPGATCTLNVTFAPTAIGTRTGSIRIDDDASNGPHVVPLSGVGGFGQVIVLEPPNVAFPLVLVGTDAAVAVTFTNNGAGTVNISSVTTTGDFAAGSACGSSLAPATACAITIRFTPTAAGSRTGTLSVTDDAPGSPHVATLMGTGYARGPLVSLVHSTLGFAGQAVGSTSAPATAQFMNIGTDALVISGITTTAEFAQTNSCASSLPPQGICTMSVTFSPTAPGTRTGTITIRDNAPNGFQTIALTGTGTDAGSGSGPLVGLAPATLAFGNAAIGSVTASQIVTVTNRGAAPLTVSGVSTTGDFAQTSACGSALSPGASCAINVTFTPTAPGPRVGLLLIADNAPGAPQSIPLAGTGTGAVGPSVVLSPASLGFGAQPIGATSGARTATVTNIGGAPLSLDSLAVDGDFAQTNTCGGSLAAGASCTVAVTFTPSVVGTRTGKVTLVDNAPGSPHTIGLAGIGGIGQIQLSPASLDFGVQTVGTSGTAGSFTIQNVGTVSVDIKSITATGDFAQTSTCGDTLGGNASCIVTVTFTPTAGGKRTGTVSIVDDAPGSPHEVVLTGNGS